ncbi:peptidoglycan-N-acetylglucosamine deacetylase [Entomortierella parvispora]|uniref:Peptidoglycan-N-acetylglucosamine deacetylase n=1 Tax=Entomortierella parvispora TaxID=205924 RepID=A0A9P3H102_9FUNG|nr:peptidoglycan-N-acetylglucosamine deacetylase [Entomortierella parvispora]
MVQFSLNPSTKNSQLRRQIMLLVVLALTAPILFRAVAGTAVSYNNPSYSHATSPSLDEAMELLSSPRNYHGAVRWSRPDLLRLEAVEDEREPASRAKNRMNAAPYPIKDRIPDLNSPEVKAWIEEINWSKVPNIPVAKGLKDAPNFPECPPKEKVDSEACWWSCDGCVAESDIMTCPTQGDWGLTYDDGPSEDTRDLMSHLKSKKITATFFIVGSRVLEYPEILKEQVAQGHHLAMHTWSHAGLTTLTNHQIVAEIKWTEKIIKDVTGLTMKYVRPPYGDTDNRVREILRQMGYSTVIWTLGWDTNDWRLLQHQIKTSEIMSTFNSALNNLGLVKSQRTGELGGPITLEHDLIPETINLSKKIIPLGVAKGLKPMSLAQCLGDPSPYQGPKAGTGSEDNGKSDTTKPASTSGGNGGAAVTSPNNKAVPSPDNNNKAVPSPNNNDKAVPSPSNNNKAAPSPNNNNKVADETAPKNSEDPLASSKTKKNDAIMLHDGLQALGYAAMGLSAVASFMLTL